MLPVAAITVAIRSDPVLKLFHIATPDTKKTALSVSRPIRHYKIDLMQFENRELTYRVGQKSGATNSWP